MNIDRHRSNGRNLQKLNRSNLEDTYVIQKITHGANFDIPPELIALKREQLTLYRLARQIRQSIEKEEK